MSDYIKAPKGLYKVIPPEKTSRVDGVPTFTQKEIDLGYDGWRESDYFNSSIGWTSLPTDSIVMFTGEAIDWGVSMEDQKPIIVYRALSDNGKPCWVAENWFVDCFTKAE